MRYLISTILILAFSAPLLAQEEAKAPNWNFKSKDVRDAIRQYGAAVSDLNNKGEAALKKLEDGYNKRVKEQRLELLVEFEKALDAATKSRDLDEAVKIRDAIKALHGGAEPPGAAGQMEFGGGGTKTSNPQPQNQTKKEPEEDRIWQSIAGTWTMRWGQGDGPSNPRSWKISRAGILQWDSGSVKWQLVWKNGRILYLSTPKHQNIEIIPHGDRLVVLGWTKQHGRHPLKNLPDYCGIATRVR